MTDSKEEKDRLENELENEDQQNEALNDEESEETSTGSDEPETNPLEAKEKEYNELYDKYMRLMAEFENFRRRSAKEKQALISNASEQLLLNILPVLDDFERAIPAMKKSDDKVAIIEGVNLVYDKFTKIMDKNGLKEIKAVGEPFDPEYHEAVTKIAAPSKKLKGKVVDQIEKGYTLNDKIIRYAKVVVGE